MDLYAFADAPISVGLHNRLRLEYSHKILPYNVVIQKQSRKRPNVSPEYFFTTNLSAIEAFMHFVSRNVYFCTNAMIWDEFLRHFRLG